MKHLKGFNQIVEDIEFNKINESIPSIDFENEVSRTESYKILTNSLSISISEFYSRLKNEIGYEEGDMDNDRALSNLITEYINKLI